MRTAAILLLLAGLSLPVASARAEAGPAAAEQPPRTEPARACGRGSTPAVVGGRLRCLRAGTRCDARYEADYRRYRFTCAKGVLRRR
ncbi:MAG: hypothetical protein R3C15_23615 [Thermoleophilia bacterium]